jgi:membrane associated rhomboid family serine protease
MTNPFPSLAESARNTRVSYILASVTLGMFALGASLPGFSPVVRLTAGRVPVDGLSLVTFLFASPMMSDAALAAVILVYFGRDLEKHLGPLRFLLIYFTSALAGVAAQVAGQPQLPIGGGTAATIGVLVVYAYLWPLNSVSMLGALSIGPRQFLMLTVGYRFLFGGLVGGGAGLSVLGGLGMGALWCAWLSRTSAASKYRRTLRTALVGDAASWSGFQWSMISRSGLHPVTLEELDRVMSKANDKGMRALSDEERAFVHRLRLQSAAPGSPSDQRT